LAISTYCTIGCFSGEEVRRTSFDLVPQYHNATKLSGYVALRGTYLPDFIFLYAAAELTVPTSIYIQAVRQTVRIVTIDHPQNLLRTGDRATVIFEFIAHPEFVKAGMKLLFREGKTKVEIAKHFLGELYHETEQVQCRVLALSRIFYKDPPRLCE
jgi:hypothetical protein